MSGVNNFLNTPGAPAAPPPPPVEKQRDGTPMVDRGQKPTRAPLQTRSASPANYATSGIERAMGSQADRMHPSKRR